MVDDPTIWFNEPLFKRTVHPATSPWPLASVVRKVWTAIVPDEPYRAKGLCREGNFPLTPCTFALSPLCSSSSDVVRPSILGLSSQELPCSPRSSLASLASAIGGSSFLLDNLSGLYDFLELYGLDWTLLTGMCRFLCLSFPASTLLDLRLVLLVRLCCVVYSLLHAMPKYNIFNYTTYPDLVVKMEQDLAFTVMSRFAPKWLLGCCRFTNRLHSNLEIEVPSHVVDTFLAGLKYISPIAMKSPS